MPIPRFRTVRPGDILSAADENRQREELTRLGSITGSGWVEIDESGAGLSIRLDVPRNIFIELTAESAGAYAWKEKVRASAGTWVDRTGGLTGTTTSTPARDVNGTTDIPAGRIVRAWPAHPYGNSDEFLFDYGEQAPAELVVTGTDSFGDPAELDPCTELNFSQFFGGLTLDGTTVSILPASRTQEGCVTDGPVHQQFGGIKDFYDRVEISNRVRFKAAPGEIEDDYGDYVDLRHGGGLTDDDPDGANEHYPIPDYGEGLRTYFECAVSNFLIGFDYPLWRVYWKNLPVYSGVGLTLGVVFELDPSGAFSDTYFNGVYHFSHARFRVSNKDGITGTYINPTHISVQGGIVVGLGGTRVGPPPDDDPSGSGPDDVIDSIGLGSDQANSNTLTLADITVEADTVLIVVVGQVSEEGAAATTVTFDGEPLSVAVSINSPEFSGLYGTTSIWKLHVAAETTGDIVITDSGDIDLTIAQAIQVEGLVNDGTSLATGAEFGAGDAPTVPLSGSVSGTGAYVQSAFLMFQTGGAVASWTWGGHTSGGQDETATIGSDGVAQTEGYKIPTDTGTHAATLTLSPNPTAWAAVIMAII